MEQLRPPETLWHEGANYAADAIILRGNNICLIKRKVDGSWALPGGFLDNNEGSHHAAIREACEETGLNVDSGICVFSDKVNDPRNSADRWIESDAYLFECIDEKLSAGDDASDAKWFPIDQLPEHIYGSHEEMIDNARNHLALQDFLREATELPVRSGHMGYAYSLYRNADMTLFTKSHIPDNFSDARRAEHSQFYLKKESVVLDHLRTHQYRHIPRYHKLVGQSVLTMEGLSEDDGWVWKVPDDNTYSLYMQDILGALDELATIDPIVISEPVAPSIHSFFEEGWASLTPSTLSAIEQRLHYFHDQLQNDTAALIDKLIDDLPVLATTIQPPTQAIVYSHHDARVNNIAWHRNHGIRIIDWSWYSAGTRRADSTAFLIDVAKSGHDVTHYMDNYFDKNHAKLLIGFWLCHSLWPTRTSDDSVRLHQVASALTAYQLIQQIGE